MKRVLALLALLAMLGAACGSGDDAASDGDAGSPEATTGAGETDQAEGAPEGDPILLGAVRDSSSEANPSSRVAQQVMDLAVKEFNAAGGIDGRPVELIYENDENDPNRTLVATQTLLSRDADVLIGITGSASVAQMGVPSVENSIVTFAPMSLSPLPENPDFFFQVAPQISTVTEALTAGMQGAGVETLAAYGDSTPIIDVVLDLFTSAFEEAGIEVIATERVPPDATDATSQVLRLRDSGADAIFVTSQGGPVEALAYNTVDELGIELPVFAGPAMVNQPEQWELAGTSTDGMVASGSIHPDNERANELRALLEEEYGDDFIGLSAFHAQTWDAMQILRQAIEEAGSTDGAAVKEAIESIGSFESAQGPPGYTLDYSADDHIGPNNPCALVLIEFQGGQPAQAFEHQPTCE